MVQGVAQAASPEQYEVPWGFQASPISAPNLVSDGVDVRRVDIDTGPGSEQIVARPEKRERIVHMLNHVAQNNVIERGEIATGCVKRLPDLYAFRFGQFPRGGIGLHAEYGPAGAPRDFQPFSTAAADVQDVSRC